MRLRCAWVGLALALWGACAITETANATASTHVWGPSTDVQAFNVWHITCDLYLPVYNDDAGSGLPTITNVGLTVGVLPFKKLNMELGFDHKTGLGAVDRYPLYGNAKIGIPESALGRVSPAVAAGVFDVGTNGNQTDFNIIYGKIAKTFSLRDWSLGRFSLGYFIGNERLLIDQEGKKDNSGLLAAWERTVPELSDNLWICLEYMGTKSAYGCFNAGASWKCASNVAILVGYEVFNNKTLVNTATIQVDIDL
ncbi:MAG: hypothetical protein HZB43_08960 [candidate division Zixibacteria bacterium]|nr:hypothetical protein [candidate division Zixibacteria bacterium]